MKFEQPSNKIEIEGHALEYDTDRFVEFGDMAVSVLQRQCQYVSRYTTDTDEQRPNLSKDLRIQGSADDYHEMKIHKDDIPEFLKRIREFTAQ